MSPDLASLLPSWLLHLRGARRSPRTITTYETGVRQFLTWCQRTDTPAVLTRAAVNAWIADMLAAGAEGKTAQVRQLAVRRFAAWLAEEGELDGDPLLGLKPPAVDQKTVPILDDDQVRALIKACTGPGFRDRRDEAIVRLMVETGIRSDELISLRLSDLDATGGTALVRRGKGGKARRLVFGARTGVAIDRYLRMRRAHRLAGGDTVWLGEAGKQFGYDALWRSLKIRAEAAGLPAWFTPHKLRNVFASRWLEAGGSEGGLMALAGWSRRDMLDRYSRATSERRAAEEARRLNLGDRL